MEQSPLEKLIFPQLDMKFPAWSGTRRFIIVFTSARLWSLSWARCTTIPRPCAIFHNKLVFLRCEEFLARRPTPKLEDHLLPAARDCLFTIFAIILHIWRPSPPSTDWKTVTKRIK